MRWVDLQVTDPMTRAFRYSEGMPIFKDRMPLYPDAAPGLKESVKHDLQWLDTQMAGKTFLAGDRFTLADILLFSFLAFGEQIGQPLDRGLKNLSAWYDRVAARESVKA